MFFNALMWNIQLVGKYKLENSFGSTAWQTKNPPIVQVQHWNEAFNFSYVFVFAVHLVSHVRRLESHLKLAAQFDKQQVR